MSKRKARRHDLVETFNFNILTIFDRKIYNYSIGDIFVFKTKNVGDYIIVLDHIPIDIRLKREDLYDQIKSDPLELLYWNERMFELTFVGLDVINKKSIPSNDNEEKPLVYDLRK